MNENPLEHYRFSDWNRFITIFSHPQRRQETINEKNIPIPFTAYFFPILTNQNPFLEPGKLREIEIKSRNHFYSQHGQRL